MEYFHILATRILVKQTLELEINEILDNVPRGLKVANGIYQRLLNDVGKFVDFLFC